MADLKETDVEKAGKVTFRGKRMSSAQRRAIATDKITPRSRITRSGGAHVLPGWGRKGNLSAHVVRKSADPIETLYAEIEKAKASHGSAKNQTHSNMEYGRKLHAAGKAKRNEALRLKAVAAGKKLLGRKIYL